jgi:hypothetical protein
LAVLDILHREGIEIVSPGFMNQRVLDGSEKILPKAATRKEKRTASEDNVVAEDVMFDKAEQAERFNLEKTQLLQSIAAFEVQLKDAVKEEKDVISLEIEHLREQMETLELIIAEVLQKKD